MRHRLIFHFILLFALQSVFGQHRGDLPNYATPNASAFGLYGAIPVNLFTGIPNISIPLLEVKEANITVPITLTYHPSSVQPNNHPGWTGLGMSLLSGGVITRVQRGMPDELKASSGEESGFFYHYNKLNSTDWYVPDRLKVLAEEALLSTTVRTDAMPDEFAFSFLGYAGEFMMGHDGQWKVSCDEKIKVVVDPTEGIITAANLRDEIRLDMPANISAKSYYYFNKFKLITPDGTTYEFGGINATEFSTQYRAQEDSYVVPTSWYLTKIKTQNGHEINFQYLPKDKICALAHQYSYAKYDRPGEGWFSLDPACSGATVSLSRLPANGFLLFPVYLESIETSYTTIKFIKSETTELRYKDSDLREIHEGDSYFEFRYIENPLLELKWYKLDQIQILNKDNILLKAFDLKYTNSLTERLKLLSVTEIDANGEKLSPYSFTYNALPLPAEYGSDQVDHWGYYNGSVLTPYTLSQPIDSWITAYPPSRAPDETNTFNKAEVLERIDYPTGGHTVFEFEPHGFSKEVSNDRSALIVYTQNRPGGGVRIKKITSFEADGSELLSKEFYYVFGFTGQSNISALLSSGILGGGNQYYWPGYQGADLDGNLFTYDLFSSNSLLPSPFNGQGSHIGYSQVIEREIGNGYTKTYFSNFDNDVFGFQHMDEGALAYIDPERSVYSPFSSKAIERGKPQLIESFDEQGYLAQATKIQYEALTSDFVRTVDLQFLNICSDVTATAQTVFGTSFKKYIYSFNAIREEITVFDSDKSGSLTSTTLYEYNPYNNSVNRIINTNSDGLEIRKEILYPNDISDGVISNNPEERAIELMAGDAHMVNVPIEITEFHNGKVTKANVKIFKDQSGIIVPSADYKADLIVPLPVNDPTSETYKKVAVVVEGNETSVLPDERCKLANVYQFDDKGNMTQVIAEDGITTSYLWGYKQLVPIAKIINASHAEVTAVLGGTALLDLNDPDNDDQVRLILQTLRDNPALDKALITTYTYDHLYGLTSVTDPNAKVTYYSYDTFGRLRLIKDNDGNILKRYEYDHRLR